MSGVLVVESLRNMTEFVTFNELVAMDSHHRREALLNWLRGKGTSTASEAADKFGVSTRTILRDVSALRENGEPIESDAGRGGGLRVDLLRSLPPLRVRLEEVVGLFLWFHLTRLSCHAPLAGCGEQAVEKLMGILPPSRGQEIRRTLRRVLVRHTGEGPGETSPGDPSTLAVIERSLNTRRGMSFVYDDDGERIAVVAEVQGLLLEGCRWYLLGTDTASGHRQRWRLDLLTGAGLADDVRVHHLALESFVNSAVPLTSDRMTSERMAQRIGA